MAKIIISRYKKNSFKRIYYILSIGLVLLFVTLISIGVGPAEIGLYDLYKLLAGKGTDFSSQIVFQIRLPRIIGGIIAGTALAVSGAVIQSLLRNPLASPFTIGISGSSAFGAAFAIIILGTGTGMNEPGNMAIINNPYIISISAFLWSLFCIGFIVLLSGYRGATPEVIILAGIIISSLFGAGITAMQYFANDVELASIVFWTFGDLGRASWEYVYILAISIFPIMLFFIYHTWNYKSIQAGDEYARSLGIKVNRVRISGLVAASLATAIVVSFFGIIAFVGLVVPHIVRRIIGNDDQFVIPASAVFGGMFLLLSDTLARTIISPVILPVGILTSFMGAPLFLFLLLKTMNKIYY